MLAIEPHHVQLRVYYGVYATHARRVRPAAHIKYAPYARAITSFAKSMFFGRKPQLQRNVIGIGRVEDGHTVTLSQWSTYRHASKIVIN